MRNLPPEAKSFLQNPDAPEVRAKVRLFLPPSADSSVSNTAAFLFCAFLSFVFCGAALVFFFAKRDRNISGGIAMAVLGALFIWATIYAFGGLRVRFSRLAGRKARYGYWVLDSGILARNSVRRITYLPWDNITEITEATIYTRFSDHDSYVAYPALRVAVMGANREKSAFYFSGFSDELVDKDKVDTRHVNLECFRLPGKGEGEFRMFKNACSDFKAF